MCWFGWIAVSINSVVVSYVFFVCWFLFDYVCVGVCFMVAGLIVSVLCLRLFICLDTGLYCRRVSLWL